MNEQRKQSVTSSRITGSSKSVMRVSRKWINEEFADLSHVTDREFAKIMTAMGQKVLSCELDNDTGDTVVSFEISDNRPDCYAVIGLARTAAAAFNVPLKHYEPQVKGSDLYSIYEYLDVDVAAYDLCNRCTCRMVTNVQVAVSPQWLQQRLITQGIEPVNNIIDIANYVMMEYGHPIQVFDYRGFPSGELLVREAEDGELLLSADGCLRSLKQGMLIIADSENPIGLAGIMGGATGAIRSDTVTVVFEAASFSGEAIVKTARALGLQTHISDRVVKNPDPMMTVPAIQRACELVELLACGEVMDGMLDILNYIPEPRTLEFSPTDINRFLRTDLTEATILSYLKRLEIPVEGDLMRLPYFRQDLNSVEDLANEIARLHSCQRLI